MTPPNSGEREAMARRFHEAYERLAPSFGYETRRDSAMPWDSVPERNRKLMVAVCGEVFADQVPVPQPLAQRILAALVKRREWELAAELRAIVERKP